MTILAIALPFIIGPALAWSLCRMAAITDHGDNPQHFGADVGGVGNGRVGFHHGLTSPVSGAE